MTAVFDMLQGRLYYFKKYFETHTPALFYCMNAARFSMMELEVAAGDAASGVSESSMPHFLGEYT